MISMASISLEPVVHRRRQPISPFQAQTVKIERSTMAVQAFDSPAATLILPKIAVVTR
jgi:hypothetical protein